MAIVQAEAGKDNKHRPAAALKDLVIIAAITFFVFILSFYFNAFVFLIELFNKHPQWITYIDEIITVLFTVSVSFAIFAWRRYDELKKETVERLRLQDELIQCAATRAETDRIIAKQLHEEIEQRKKLEKKLQSFTSTKR